MATVGIPVKTAARMLGLDERRVRTLIARSILEAELVGGRWLIDPASIERRSRQGGVDGRPYSPRMAWAALAAYAGDWSALHVRGLEPTERHRIRERLATTPLLQLAPRLRTRARTLRLRAHPAYAARLADDPRVVRTGVSAAVEHRADISAPGVVELYAPARSIAPLRRQYHLTEADEPNVVLHVVDSCWPFPADARIAPRQVVALDLFDADDERTRRAGRELLARTAH